MPICALLAVVLLAGCGSSSPRRAATASAVAPQPHLAAGLTGQVTSSELVLGQNRFTMGIEDRQGVPIPDAQVHLKFFRVSGTAVAGSVQATLKSEADATFRAPAREAGLPEIETVTRPDGSKTTVQSAGAGVGVYEAPANFDAVGGWAVEADVRGKDASQSGTVRVPFSVIAQSLTPAIGSDAPPSKNLTTRDAPLALLDTSARATADMHTETIAEAIAAHHPTLVLFATPGFCQSRFCGPELELARKLEPKYQGKVDFIHIEIWRDPLKVYMPAVLEWHLPSEPWFFIVDRAGKVSAKFEGPTTLAEVDAALQKVAG